MYSRFTQPKGEYTHEDTQTHVFIHIYICVCIYIYTEIEDFKELVHLTVRADKAEICGQAGTERIDTAVLSTKLGN